MIKDDLEILLYGIGGGSGSIFLWLRLTQPNDWFDLWWGSTKLIAGLGLITVAYMEHQTLWQAWLLHPYLISVFAVSLLISGIWLQKHRREAGLLQLDLGLRGEPVPPDTRKRPLAVWTILSAAGLVASFSYAIVTMPKITSP